MALQELRSGESGRAGRHYIRRAEPRAPHSCAQGRLTISPPNMQSFVVCLLVLVVCAAAAPQREGAAFSNEAIKQAQNTFLIPKDAEIQKVI
ncbi:uncharacterized protein LOC134742580 [Cydia strobilella]|uniref:uncharacterized protein LOC134742580 n=1 Tax=Cydia strobilella TaxID=1100964 RepID=UPI003004F7F1